MMDGGIRVALSSWSLGLCRVFEDRRSVDEFSHGSQISSRNHVSSTLDSKYSTQLHPRRRERDWGVGDGHIEVPGDSKDGLDGIAKQ